MAANHACSEASLCSMAFDGLNASLKYWSKRQVAKRAGIHHGSVLSGLGDAVLAILQGVVIIRRSAGSGVTSGPRWWARLRPCSSLPVQWEVGTCVLC